MKRRITMTTIALGLLLSIALWSVGRNVNAKTTLAASPVMAVQTGVTPYSTDGGGDGTFIGGGWNGTSHIRLVTNRVSSQTKADVIAFGNDGMYVGVNEGNRFRTGFRLDKGYCVATTWSDPNLFPRMMADLNGDGWNDIIGFAQDAVVVSLRNMTVPSGYYPQEKWSTSYTVGGGWTNNDTLPRRVADVNGDGYADIIGFGSNDVFVSLNNKNKTFAPPVSWTKQFAHDNWPNNTQFPRLVVDVNKDGAADIVGFSNLGVEVALSTKTGFAPSTKWSTAFGFAASAGGWNSNDVFPRMVGDVNGDGYADIVGFANNGVDVALNTGKNSFAGETKWSGEFANAAGGWTSNSTYPRFVADMNADGKADIVGFAENGVYVATSTGTGFKTSVHWTEAYGHRKAGILPNWMTDSQDVIKDRHLSDLAVPGSHDTPTYTRFETPGNVASAWFTQRYDINSQMLHGARYFDFRVNSDGKLYGHDPNPINVTTLSAANGVKDIVDYLKQPGRDRDIAFIELDLNGLSYFAFKLGVDNTLGADKGMVWHLTDSDRVSGAAMKTKVKDLIDVKKKRVVIIISSNAGTETQQIGWEDGKNLSNFDWWFALAKKGLDKTRPAGSAAPYPTFMVMSACSTGLIPYNIIELGWPTLQADKFRATWKGRSVGLIKQDYVTESSDNLNQAIVENKYNR